MNMINTHTHMGCILNVNHSLCEGVNTFVIIILQSLEYTFAFANKVSYKYITL